MDIKAKIEELTKKITSDKSIMENFKTNPIKTVEGLIGVDHTEPSPVHEHCGKK